jgi:hypothetical protein
MDPVPAFKAISSHCGLGSREPDNCRSMVIPILVSVADPGCLYRIQPKFSIPDPGSRIKKIPATKNSSITHKSVTVLCSQKYGTRFLSRIRIPTFSHFGYRIRIKGSKKAPDPGALSATLNFYLAYVVEILKHKELRKIQKHG